MLRRCIALAFLAVFISSPAWSYVHRESVEKVIPAEGRSTIRVSNPTGLIKVRPADGANVVLEAKKVAKAKTEDEARDLAEKARVRVIERGDEIEIKVELPSKTKHKSLLGGILKLSVSTHVTVELYLDVPSSMELHLGSTSGDIDVEGARAGGHLGAASGDIWVSDCVGDFSIGVASGDIEVEGVEVSGEVVVNTSSGDVTVHSVARGAVEVEIACSSGDIELVVAKGSSYHLELGTVSGGISCKVPLTVEKVSRRELRGDVGSGGGSVILSTSSGDIRVREG
jgi:hypothetical protein